jgi:hypothetical protein
MKRRVFLKWSSLLGTASCIGAEERSPFVKRFREVEPVIRAVQEHMFPEGSRLPSAASMRVTHFMFETMHHPSFDRDIRRFVIAGARELQRREKGRFTVLPVEEKERALRAYEETVDGRQWLSRIIVLTMEALFSDPLYGSNINEVGWRALHTEGGYPRPTTQYIEL